MRGNLLLMGTLILILLVASFVIGMFMYTFAVPAQRITISVGSSIMGPIEKYTVKELNEMNALDTAAGQGVLELQESNQKFYGKAVATMSDQHGALAIAGWLLFIGALLFVLSQVEIRRMGRGGR